MITEENVIWEINNSQVRRRVKQYILLFILLALCYVTLYNTPFFGDKHFHTLLEVVSTMLAFLVGILALIRFHTKKSNTVLFAGAGFIGTALLEAHHTLLTSSLFEQWNLYTPPALIAWSWHASRIFLSVLMFLSWVGWLRQEKYGEKGVLREKTVYGYIAIFTIANILLFALLPLPNLYHFSYLFVGRPEELIAGTFFLLTFIGYYQKGHWKFRHWEHWLMLFLIASFMTQFFFMSHSTQMFDHMFNYAHIIKILSYLFILVGLLISVYQVHSKLEEAKEDLEKYTSGLEKTNEAIKELYLDLEEKNKELQELDKLKSDFVSTVSHELRTPLAISTEGINLIVDGITGPINDKQRKLLTTSKQNLERLNTIINDLLDISKIEAGKIEIRRGLVNFNALLTELAESYKKIVETRKQKLMLDMPEEGMFLYADGDKIIQIITNLLSNAHKFTQEGGMLTVKVEHKENSLLCSVKDSGCGISEGDMSKLFGKFEQFDRVEGPGIKGTGLGLAICKALVELHGGKIWCESKINQGTTFFFTLPLYEKLKKEFNQKVGISIKETIENNKPLTALMIDITNYKSLKKKYSEKELFNMVNSVLSAVGRSLNLEGDYYILYDFHIVYAILPNTPKWGGHAVLSKIKHLLGLGDYDKYLKGDLKLNFGISTVPENAKNAESLIENLHLEVGRRRNLLVVDDHPQIYEILKARIKSDQIHLIAAENGEAALERIKEKVPDLIVLDIMMPKMNGYELLGRLTSNKKFAYIPIIILSAKSTSDIKKEYMQMGDIPVFEKTGDFTKLVDMINEKIL